jgi:antitoxin (DNA-binding transcriptional repressor) of toxin-antitoxin stability system
MTTVSVQEIQRDPLGYLDRVRAGETFVVLQDGRPVAEIKPIAAAPVDRRPHGLCAGEFVVPADFDASLPEEVLQEFEGG